MWKHVKNTLLHIFTALVFIPIIPLLVMVGIITAVPVLTLMILFVPIEEILVQLGRIGRAIEETRPESIRQIE